MKREEITRIFRNPPLLETERTYMRKLSKSDSADMYEYSKREDVTRYLLWSPHRDENYTFRYLGYIQSRYRAGDFYDWGVVLKENGKMIGTCGFTRLNTDDNSGEIGYVLNPDYWDMGLATETVAKVISYGFEVLGLNRIEGRYMAGNEKSRRVMEKNGMTYEGTLRDLMFVKGEYVSVGICSILRKEYYSGKNNY